MILRSGDVEYANIKAFQVSKIGSLAVDKFFDIGQIDLSAPVVIIQEDNNICFFEGMDNISGTIYDSGVKVVITKIGTQGITYGVCVRNEFGVNQVYYFNSDAYMRVVECVINDD